MRMVKAEPYMDCNMCGKPMYDGDKAYATVGGVIDRTVEGFYPSDKEPYYTIACDECGQKISDAISRLEVELKARGYEFYFLLDPFYDSILLFWR